MTDEFVKYFNLYKKTNESSDLANWPSSVTVQKTIVDDNGKVIPMDTVLDITYSSPSRIVLQDVYTLNRQDFVWHYEHGHIEAVSMKNEGKSADSSDWKIYQYAVVYSKKNGANTKAILVKDGMTMEEALDYSQKELGNKERKTEWRYGGLIAPTTYKIK